jgi:hypothetical protein
VIGRGKKIQMGMEKLLIYRGVHQLIKPRSSQDGAFLFEQKPVAINSKTQF